MNPNSSSHVLGGFPWHWFAFNFWHTEEWIHKFILIFLPFDRKAFIYLLCLSLHAAVIDRWPRKAWTHAYFFMLFLKHPQISPKLDLDRKWCQGNTGCWNDTVWLVYDIVFFLLHKVNNTALAQVIVLPNPGSAQFDSVMTKVMNCHLCFGKSLKVKTFFHQKAHFKGGGGGGLDHPNSKCEY